MANQAGEVPQGNEESSGDYVDWMGHGSYYHWKLSELGQLSACPHLQDHPVPTGPIPDQVDGKIHPDPPLQELQPLVPLGRTEVGGHTPLTEVANLLPLVEVANQSLLLEAGNQPPPGPLLNCLLGQREVVMASHGTKGSNRDPKRVPGNATLPNWAHTRQGGSSQRNLWICG